MGEIREDARWNKIFADVGSNQSNSVQRTKQIDRASFCNEHSHSEARVLGSEEVERGQKVLAQTRYMLLHRPVRGTHPQRAQDHLSNPTARDI